MLEAAGTALHRQASESNPAAFLRRGRLAARTRTPLARHHTRCWLIVLRARSRLLRRTQPDHQPQRAQRDHEHNPERQPPPALSLRQTLARGGTPAMPTLGRAAQELSALAGQQLSAAITARALAQVLIERALSCRVECVTKSGIEDEVGTAWRHDTHRSIALPGGCCGRVAQGTRTGQRSRVWLVWSQPQTLYETSILARRTSEFRSASLNARLIAHASL
jgi:hypothetical protein